MPQVLYADLSLKVKLIRIFPSDGIESDSSPWCMNFCFHLLGPFMMTFSSSSRWILRALLRLFSLTSLRTRALALGRRRAKPERYPLEKEYVERTSSVLKVHHVCVKIRRKTKSVRWKMHQGRIHRGCPIEHLASPCLAVLANTRLRTHNPRLMSSRHHLPS